MAFGDLVQSAVADADANATAQATFASAVTPGNLIVVVTQTGDGPLTPNGDLLEAVDNHDTGQDDGHAIGYRVVQSGDGTTWGFTQPSADQFEIILYEFEGPWEASPLDQTGVTAFVDSPTSQAVTASGATTQADELVIATWGDRAIGGVGNSAAIAGVDNSFITLLQEHNNFGNSARKSVGIATKVLTATGTPTVTATFDDTSGRSGAALATFKKGAGGGGGTVVRPSTLTTLGIQ